MLLINVFCENQKSYQFNFNEEEKVQSLYNKFNNKNGLLFYYNIIALLPSMTFGFYKIRSGAFIYCFDTKSTKLVSEYSKKIFIENMEKTRKMKEMKMEQTRLHDIFLSKIDSGKRKPRSFLLKFCHQKVAGKLLKNDQEELKGNSTIIPSNSSSPSVETLPIFWETPKTPVLA